MHICEQICDFGLSRGFSEKSMIEHDNKYEKTRFYYSLVHITVWKHMHTHTHTYKVI